MIKLVVVSLTVVAAIWGFFALLAWLVPDNVLSIFGEWVLLLWVTLA